MATRVGFALLVLALHWVALEFLAHRLKAPLRTEQARPLILHIQWTGSSEALVPARSTDLSALHTPVTIPLSEISKLAEDPSPPATALTDLSSEKYTKTDGTNQGWDPTLYRSSAEVDTTAAPTIDWVVNRQSVPTVGATLLVVTVWISATGVIDHFELVQQQPSGDWATAALSSLQTTGMEPATLGGVPVASTMTIEISLDNHIQ